MTEDPTAAKATTSTVLIESAARGFQEAVTKRGAATIFLCLIVTAALILVIPQVSTWKDVAPRDYLIWGLCGALFLSLGVLPLIILAARTFRDFSSSGKGSPADLRSDR